MSMFAAILLACNPSPSTVATPPPPSEPPPTPDAVVYHTPETLEVTAESLGEVDAMTSTGHGEILTHTDGELWLFDPLLRPESLGLFQGELGQAARLWDGTLLVERDGILGTYDGDWRSTPLDEAIVDLERWVDLPDALWVEDANGLRRINETVFTLTLDEAPLRSPWAVGGSIFGTDAVWASHDGLVVGLTERAAGWMPLVLHEVDAWDLGVDRDGWVVVAGEDGLVHLRNPTTEDWSVNSLPSTVHRVYAHPRGEAVWMQASDTWFVLLDGQFFDVGDLGNSGLAIDALGRMLRSVDGEAERLSVTRPVQIVGIEPGEILATEREVSIAPTAPLRVVSVAVNVFGGETILSEQPWILEVNPLEEPDGSYAFEVDVTYDDGAHGVDSIDFWVGDPVVPTWSADVEPIYERHCDQCHNDDVETVLDSREAWVEASESILDEVQSGRMPLDGDPLPDSDIATIRSWRNAGFPP